MSGTDRRYRPSLRASRERSAWRTGYPLLAIVLAGSVALSACGGGSPSATASTTSTTTAATSATNRPGNSLSAFQACMQKHGVKFGGFGTGATGSFPAGGSPAGGGFNSSAFRKASAACASLRPQGFGSGTGGFSSAALAAYRNCLKLHGVTLPSGSAVSSTTSTTLNTRNAATQKALAACASLRPKGFGAGAGGFSNVAFTAYRNCLKLHGVTLPAGSFGGRARRRRRRSTQRAHLSRRRSLPARASCRSRPCHPAPLRRRRQADRSCVVSLASTPFR